MENVRINKAVLLETLKANRDKHQKVFEEALEGYRAAAIAELDHALADAKAGKKIARGLTLIEPSNQTKDYDRVIRMLEMSVDDVIELDEHSFNQYVCDEWSWKRQFSASNIRYVSEATSMQLQE